MSRKRLKQYLTLLMAIGVIAIVAGGSGTFASFNAEVTHTGNTYATGTLLLHSTSGTTTCASESNSSNSNTTSPTGCATLFTTSIGSPASGTLNTAITAGTITQVVADLTGSSTIEPGDQVKVTDGTHTDTFTATAAVTPGSAVTIPVVSATSNAYSSGSGTTVSITTFTQYASIQLKNAGTLDAKDIKFAVPSCTNAADQTLTLGTTTASSLTGAVTSIAISAAAYGAASGGTVTITNASSQSETLTLSAQVNPGDTSISVNSATLSNTYASGSTIKYSPFISGSGTLCNSLDFDIVETDSTFDHDSTSAAKNAYGCAYGAATNTAIGCTFSSASGYALGTAPSGDTALTLASGKSGNTTTELDNGQSRYFVIGVQTDVSSLSNSDQNQKATFSIKWHIDQK